VTAHAGDAADTPPSPAAFHLGPGHRIVHANPPFIDAYGMTALGQPAREAMIDLPAAAFEVMDLVFRTGRPLARRVARPAVTGGSSSSRGATRRPARRTA